MALALAPLAAVLALAGPAAPAPLKPPETRRADVVDDYFGTRVADPYRWLEDDLSPETEAWVAAQNEVSRAFLDAVPEREAIRSRLTRLWDHERLTAPVKRGGRYFFARNSGLQNQAVLHVAEGLDAEPRVLLDPNGLSPDGTVALADSEPSEDGKLLAYALAEAGSDWLTWRVRRTDTGEDLPDVVRWSKFSRASWLRDGTGFFYSRYDAPAEGAALTAVNKEHQVWFHRLGTPQDDDRLVYRRPDQPEWGFDAEVSQDGRLLVVTASRGTNPETAIFVAELGASGWKPEPLLDRLDAEYVFVGNDGDVLYFLTTNGAPRRRLVAIRRDRPEPRAWRTVLPEGKRRDVLEKVALVGGRFVATWMRDARSAVEIFSPEGKRLRAVSLPSLGTVAQLSGRERDPEVFFAFTGFTRPTTIFRLDAATGRTTPFHPPAVSFDPRRFTTRQVFFRSKDGTRIPMFLVHRAGLALDGRNPTLLRGYGGFNIPLVPYFSPTTVAWLELGGVLAVPNLRGGGEYGKAWHDAGRLGRKQNVFDDFIAAAEWLVSSRHTSSRRLAINGGSNGGLLVGAAMTQRPELFAAAVPEVGVMDMLRFHRFTIGWAWKSDYGSSETREGFEALVRYSPLHNLRPGTRYPATLVLTADHDDRVVPAHSHKFAAALQAAQGGDAPVLARIETRAGHGAGKPTAKLIAERTDVLAFLVRVLEMKLPPGFGEPSGTVPASRAQ